MEKRRVILISGLSGAGKTTAMGILEDMGYHCLDQFPVSLLPHLADLITSSEDSRYDRLVLSTNLLDFEAFRLSLSVLDIDLQILLLESKHHELLKRYKHSRRMHPALLNNIATTLEEGIQAEQEQLNKNKDSDIYLIDTSDLTVQEFKQRLNQIFSIQERPSFSISFISFGYKNGVPMDVDLMFDVRFLPNPFWEESLREMNGNDEDVYNYVMEKEETKTYLTKLEDFLDYSFEAYIKEGKNHFTIGIGCTGGQHRSVSLVNYLYDHYRSKYRCFKDHRDVE